MMPKLLIKAKCHPITINLFIYDWMRNWVFAVRLDENQNYQSMEQFMPKSGDFRRPVDIEIGQDGCMYMLEYGSVYGIDNEDARLVKIDFNGGTALQWQKRLHKIQLA
jgi:cytochrome c